MENKELMISEQERNTCTDLETIVNACSLANVGGGQFEQALTVARGVAALRAAIKPMMKNFMPLMNTRLGFLTDKDPHKKAGAGTYNENEVMEVLIEGILSGFSPAGNEINILFGGMYGTKNGFKNRLKRLAGFSDLCPFIKVPKNQGEGAIVACSATWKFNGVPDSIEREFAVKLQGGMGCDAAQGKAERRLYKTILERVTGTSFSDGEVDDADAIPTTRAEPETVKEKLEKAKAKKEPAPPVEPPAKTLSLTDAQKVLMGLPQKVLEAAMFQCEYKMTELQDLSDSAVSKVLKVASEMKQEEAPNGRNF